MSKRYLSAWAVCLIVGAGMWAPPINANAIMWKGPGWYVRSRHGWSDMLFGGPFAKREECRAKIAELVQKLAESETFYCTYHRPDGEKVTMPWNGPGWYVSDLTWGAVSSGPFEARKACADKIAALEKRDPEFVAYCWLREAP